MKRILFSKNTFFILLYSLLSLGASAQENTPMPVTELMDGAVPEGALQLNKKDGYAKLIAIKPDQTFSEEDMEGEFYQIDNIIIVYNGGKEKNKIKATELEETRAMMMEADGRDTSYRYFGEEDPNTIKKINNYKVLITKRKTIPVYHYFLIGSDQLSFLNFFITAKPEDLEKAKALGESMLNSMKFK
jgi:hypothetical protein